MKEIEYYEVFNPVLCKINQNKNPPYNYPSIFEYTKDNLSEIKIKMYNQILEAFLIEDSNNKLKNFIENLTEKKQKLEFEQFIIGGYKTENKIYLGIRTDVKGIN